MGGIDGIGAGPSSTFSKADHDDLLVTTDEEEEKKRLLQHGGLLGAGTKTPAEIDQAKLRQATEVDGAKLAKQTATAEKLSQDQMAEGQRDEDQKAQAIISAAGAGGQGGQTAHAVSPSERLRDVQGLDDSEEKANKTKGWA